MGISESIIGLLLNPVWIVIQILFSLAIVAVVYYALWFVFSTIWEIIHEPSYKWFVKRIKTLSSKLVGKFNK